MENPADQSPQGHRRKQFALVVAAYNVRRYLKDFTQSLERQTIDPEEFEVIFVDDGSTDDTLEWLENWANKTALAATVLTQPNAGQGAARNTGMRAATAEWISFPDPDDWVGESYLERVAAQLKATPSVSMIATNRVMFHEAKNSIAYDHPLAAFFYRDHVVNLARRPDYFHGGSNSSFMPLDRLREHGLEFDTRIRANFEDGLFNASYLLHCEEPSIGFLKSAEYFYRKRADNSSTLQSTNSSEHRFTTTAEHGFLGVLRLSASLGLSAPPVWLQNVILYELSWYFQQDVSFNSGTAVPPQTLEIFRAHLKEIAAHLQPHVVQSFRLRRFDGPWRVALTHGLAGTQWASPEIVVDRYDDKRKLVRLAYRFVGTEPSFTFQSAGESVEPVHTKVRSHDMFGAPLVYERLVWLSSRHNVSVWRDGERYPLATDWPSSVRTEFTPREVARKFGFPKAPVGTTAKRRRKPLLDQATLAIGRSRVAKHFLRRSWVFIDRPTDAEDSAEVMYRHVRANHQDINAWFVVGGSSPAWRRLRSGDRKVVRYGSRLWLLLLMNAEFVISSHADDSVMKPRRYRNVVGRQPWRFVFLQHGVIKDDLSRYVNPKGIDLFVTSTVPEHESIVGDRNNYVYSTREVVLAGLPRFDALYQLDNAGQGSRGKYITLAPTWRHWLEGTVKNGLTSASLAAFEGSDYAQQWLGLLRSDELRLAAESAGLRVALLPHPNLRQALTALGVPSHVTLLDFEDGKAQANFVDSAALITDYSSMAFNAAFLHRPVVYFQFDAERFVNGGHTSRPGYFSYERDGFGPVVQDVDDVVASIREALEGDGTATAEYAARADATFAFRDAHASERVTQAILEMRRAVPSPLAEFAPVEPASENR
ncbi:CDP-glycerol glycerophosphotransferase family protein [Demequina sp. NBRC 110055]|uniref:bifunctional glycosyltransferase/CDP-glycerol:glycerophosphate glycerophosphotransferase n=1 Tax=Demequina sp. NBRC 110055 TaxID=1570344 RepID=UPI0009FF2C7A|nr:CDP-glycerol glycerophosphotransferase family protein [Demequina sp. NBRC 110055]